MSEQLTENFWFSEVRCKCGKCEIPEELLPNIHRTGAFIQQLRSFLNRPIIVTSWYRCLQHNTNVGGSKHSQHMKGLAIDFNVKGLSPRVVHDILEGIMDDHSGSQKHMKRRGGLGLYPRWVHIDLRDGPPARWGK